MAMIIDAHLHLWERQQGRVDGKPVVALREGRSDFGGEIRQMMPPYMLEGRNTAEMLIANMNYAGVSGCVVTQEYIDGNQDRYLLECKKRYPKRMKICCLYEEKEIDSEWIRQFDGIKICAGRLKDPDLLQHRAIFEKADREGKFISIDLAEGELQVGAMEKLIEAYPDLRIAIGHFGMVTAEGWEKQIALARLKNVYVESGGITWLFHKEFYPYPSAIRAIAKAIEICGAEKIMVDTSKSQYLTTCTYKRS